MISNLKGIKLQGRKFSANPVDFCLKTIKRVNLEENLKKTVDNIYKKNGIPESLFLI